MSEHLGMLDLDPLHIHPPRVCGTLREKLVTRDFYRVDTAEAMWSHRRENIEAGKEFQRLAVPQI